MNVTAVGGNNAGLNAGAATFARSSLVELIGRTHLHVVHQKLLIPQNIDFYMKLIASPNDFVCKSAAPAANARHENYKLVINSANSIIRTKKLRNTAYKALMDLLLSQNMVHQLSRVRMRHLSFSANKTSINFDNVITGARPDLVVVGLVSDADLAGGYHKNPFNFRNFGVNRIKLKRNTTARPSEGYTPNVATGQYIKAYSTFLQELECDTGDKSVSFTPSEWANGHKLYAFKITEGPIVPGTYGPRFKSATGSARLEVSFSAAVNENIIVVLLYQMLGRIEFDRFNVVLVLWALAVNFTLERSNVWSQG